MIRKNSLTLAIQMGIIASVTTSAVAVNAAQAQEAAAENVERIAVTGSRIQRQDMETASPVTVIDSAAIKAEGYNTVEEILQTQPAMAGMSVGGTTNNGAGGRATVNLRGMGANRTLVLLNGRRMVNSGTGADSSVDLNTIPVALIKRVEVLKDGASAVYGSDAIAGVVNIITKDDFEGVSIEAKGSTTASNQHTTGGHDGGNKEISIIAGKNFDRGNFVIGGTFQEREGVRLSDRKWVDPGRSSTIPGGTLGGRVPVLDADGNQKVDEEGNPIWQSRTIMPDGNGGIRDRDPSKDTYDYNPDTWLQTPSKRYSLFSNGSYEFSNDVMLKADVLYTKRQSTQRMAPQPANVELDVCTAEKTKDCVDITGLGIHANDRGQVTYKRRMVDAGPRIYEQDIDTLRASMALSGYLDIGNGYDWEASYTYGRNDSKSYVHNSVNAKNMKQSIYNNPNAWFNGQPLSQDILNDVTYKETNSGGNEMHIASGVISGDAFETSAGTAGFAAGVEHRYESGFFTPDAVIQRGEGTAAQQDATSGNYNVTSAYTELSVPMTEKLTGEFALRHDHYNTFGGATTWKAGLTYEANDSVMLRTVAATGFRAPSVSELFGGRSGSYEYLTDPWGKTEDDQILVNRVSDPNLKPEKSASFTAGVVIAPQSVDGFSMTIDYWSFDIKDAITRLDVQAGLNACHAGDQAACDVHGIKPDGNLRNLRNPLTNVGRQKTSGIDQNIMYQFEGFGGDWSFNNDTTILLNFEQDGKNYTGTIGQTYGGFAAFKNNTRLNARWGDIGFNYSLRYIGDMRNYGGDKMNVGDIAYHNISATYFVTDNIVANFGIKNLTDEKPLPVYNGNTGGTVPEVYNTIGREVYAGVTMNF
ncbi:TonB-dependent receptor [Paraferrimonas sedimenticola]|uniref:TonB-dependent receptor n=1 Tax=Paraferrimonas sedimenticola TaxID=375674 RepID=A0AA37RV14_9GAMM|nr:TonB-dependent receptor [Paraferrimonas sedimenticola]GLP96155.1 TonB-dependent receptor [Paraferrimonas sedimenticola]